MENARNDKIIKKKYMQFFISVLISVLVLQITTIIDSMIVGTAIGTKEMSGVKASNPIISVVIVFTTLISVGASMVISIALGKRNNKRANDTFTFGLFASVVIGLVFTLLGIFLSNQIVSLVTSNADILEFTQEYTRIVLIASPFMMLSTYLGYALRSDGFSKLSMTLLISGGVINVCFDLILILGFNLGVTGAAIATDISYVGATLIGSIYLFMKNRNLHLSNCFSKDSELKDIFVKILKNGYPSSARLLFTAISILIANYIIGKYVGYMGIAVFSVISNLSLIATAVFQSSGAAMLPIMGVFYGEKDYKGIGLLVRFVFGFLLLLIAIIIIVLVSFAPLFYPLFGIKDAPGEYATYLRLFSIGFIFAGIDYLILYYFTALQKSYISVIVPLLEQIVICVPLLFLIPSMGMYGLIVAYIVSEFGAGFITLLVIYFIKKKKKYQNMLLLPNERTDILLDFTVLASHAEASIVSENVNNVLLKNNIDHLKANRVAVILEEMIVNTKEKEKNHKKVYIDVRIIKGEENIIISFRSNSNHPYNPLNESDEDISQKIISSFAIKLRYNQIIGFNQILMEV